MHFFALISIKYMRKQINYTYFYREELKMARDFDNLDTFPKILRDNALTFKGKPRTDRICTYLLRLRKC